MQSSQLLPEPIAPEPILPEPGAEIVSTDAPAAVAPAAVAPAGRLTLRDITKAIRTRQWAKNGLLFAGFIFAGRLRSPSPELWAEAGRVLLSFLCFCALSGAAYLINDWSDIERDRLHPVKKNRPLASGRMSVRAAQIFVVVLLGIAVLSAALVIRSEPRAWGLPVAAIFYFLLTLGYSFVLKHKVIVDVLSVAAGFVVRVVAGCVAIPVAISPWIIFCTFTLALFVALCKRRAELLEMGDKSASTRGVLPRYSVSMLDTFIAVAACLTITAYSLYTFNATTSTALSPAMQKSPWLMTTVPFVVYGVFRYLLLAHSSSVGGEPEQMLRDRPMIYNIVAWVGLVILLTMLQLH